ncbi:hypothetical protein C2W62_43565 [Candidatus Entotheonella serta]|nr:hypothetical protein C2W62_43565 [Candidatus Entotheonella serta]
MQLLEEVCEHLDEGESGLRGRIFATISQVYWYGKQLDKAKEMAQRAFEIGQGLQDDQLCADASGGLALAQMQELHVKEALEYWQMGLAYARRADDLWLQGLRLQRIALALAWLGRLDEAEDMALATDAVIYETHDWAGYSLALAAQVSVAVARGDFETAHTYAQKPC